MDNPDKPPTRITADPIGPLSVKQMALETGCLLAVEDLSISGFDVFKGWLAKQIAKVPYHQMRLDVKLDEAQYHLINGRFAELAARAGALALEYDGPANQLHVILKASRFGDLVSSETSSWLAHGIDHLRVTKNGAFINRLTRCPEGLRVNLQRGVGEKPSVWAPTTAYGCRDPGNPLPTFVIDTLDAPNPNKTNLADYIIASRGKIKTVLALHLHHTTTLEDSQNAPEFTTVSLWVAGPYPGHAHNIMDRVSSKVAYSVGLYPSDFMRDIRSLPQEWIRPTGPTTGDPPIHLTSLPLIVEESANCSYRRLHRGPKGSIYRDTLRGFATYSPATKPGAHHHHHVVPGPFRAGPVAAPPVGALVRLGRFARRFLKL